MLYRKSISTSMHAKVAEEVNDVRFLYVAQCSRDEIVSRRKGGCQEITAIAGREEGQKLNGIETWLSLSRECWALLCCFMAIATLAAESDLTGRTSLIAYCPLATPVSVIVDGGW